MAVIGEAEQAKLTEILHTLFELTDGNVFLDPWPYAYEDGTRARAFDSGVADHLDDQGVVHYGSEIGRGMRWAPRTWAEFAAATTRTPSDALGPEAPASSGTPHEPGCRPDPNHPGYWICTEAGHVSDGRRYVDLAAMLAVIVAYGAERDNNQQRDMPSFFVDEVPELVRRLEALA